MTYAEASQTSVFQRAGHGPAPTWTAASCQILLGDKSNLSALKTDCLKLYAGSSPVPMSVLAELEQLKSILHSSESRRLSREQSAKIGLANVRGPSAPFKTMLKAELSCYIHNHHLEQQVHPGKLCLFFFLYCNGKVHFKNLCILSRLLSKSAGGEFASISVIVRVGCRNQWES